MKDFHKNRRLVAMVRVKRVSGVCGEGRRLLVFLLMYSFVTVMLLIPLVLAGSYPKLVLLTLLF